MKTNLTKLCAVILLATQTLAFGQKTEVTVQKGKVIAETETKSVAVDAGRKAILEPDKNPIVTVDNPMVDDVMEIYKWAEQERQEQREKIDSTSIQLIKVENEHLFTLAYLLETPNDKSEPSNIFRIGPASILDEPKYYDLQGNLLEFDLVKINARSGYYSMHFPKPVKPGEKFRYICVSRITSDKEIRKEGTLRYLMLRWSAPNQLNYFRFILPKSGIFVDSSRPVTITDSFDGRVAVTIRNYTGPIADGMSQIAFLWPDKDGTTLADLPPRYRGLRDQREEVTAQEGRRRTAEILAGKTYEDQSTPLTTLLSLYSAAVHKDTELFLNLVDPELRELAAGQMDQIMGMAGLIVNHEFLGTPSLPEQPTNGYEHPVHLCRKGSLLREVTLEMVYRGGKWYLKGLQSGGNKADTNEETDSKASGGATISHTKPDLNAATYAGLKPGQFMKKWLILGPVPVTIAGTEPTDYETKKRAFSIDPFSLELLEPKVTVGEKEYEWAVLHSEYGVVDLTHPFGKRDYMFAYAWAQIDMAKETRATLAIGYDDIIKVWLNGQLIHEHWGLTELDGDLIPVTLRKGKNQLVLKILNEYGPWGFSCRLLEK